MAAAGVDADRSVLAAGRRLLGGRHDDAVARGVFGSSTIVFPSGRGSFVRFRAVPSRADAPAVLDALRTLADDAPELAHLEQLRHKPTTQPVQLRTSAVADTRPRRAPRPGSSTYRAAMTAHDAHTPAGTRPAHSGDDPVEVERLGPVRGGGSGPRAGAL